jgi:diguanylate cyclase (GGDEF)-like protein
VTQRTPMVLVVDDDPDARLVMGAAMRKSVMVTGMDDVASVESAYECGATDFIAKPVNWALIGHRVRYLLRSHVAMLDLQSAEACITKLAYFDSLTGLPNRQSFLDSIDGAVHQADLAGTRLAVLFVDLDRFKTINDTLGHAAGDLLLKEAAARLRQGLRPSDLLSRPAVLEAHDAQRCDLARLGGDEFTALITNVKTPEAAMAVARRIGQLIRQPFVLEGREVALTASVGISMYPEDGRDGAALLKHADTAMYHAKRSGRDNSQVYNTSLTHEIVHRAELERALRLGLDRREFHLVYQPQVDVASGRVLSVEALLRWVHPERGLVSPVEFIPLAEQIGLIERIGHWVLQTACAQAERWARAGLPITVAVNLSPLQICNQDLPQQVIDVLAQTGLASDRLELEVTEGALMQNTNLTRASLERLRGLGVRLALDDFGTGYSSLAYLTRFPIDNIKIDRCFVNGLTEGGESEAIVRAVIAMARSLGMRVTAEGVETLQQADALKSMGCDSLQGYYFSRPVPAEQIPAAWANAWHAEGLIAPVCSTAERPLLGVGRIARQPVAPACSTCAATP